MTLERRTTLSSNAMLAIGALLFFTMMNLMKFHTPTQPAKKTLPTAGEVAQHNVLQQKLSKYKKSFRISNDNNRNRYVGLSKIWTEFSYTKGAEVGVWKGDFSKYMLENMPTLTSYILVDSWRHLDQWNKPWNKDDAEFEAVFQTAMQNTKSFQDAGICSVVRGTNVEAAPQIPDASLDFVYLDGDHTLRGIMFDLNLYAPKVRPGGMVCGDDYTFGQHETKFDPTMVKPYVDLYGELNHLSIVDLGEVQFCYIVPP
mmetsp:Transcript_25415/g.39042  ORF Transcript_25415/g.39042 Transcript_25415/m.39042 type:complete len:257 (-) Transcript_25415:294-1064(-)